MKAFQYCVAMTIVVALISQSVSAGFGASKPTGCDETCCDSCNSVFHYCQNETKTVKIRKHCYKVECEDVCIPPVCLPKCLISGGKSDCCNDGSNGCDAACGTEGCQDCSRSKQQKWFLERLCSKLTDCRTRKVHTLKKNEYEIEKCVCVVRCVQATASLRQGLQRQMLCTCVLLCSVR